MCISCKTTNVAKNYPDWVGKDPTSKKGIYAVGSADMNDTILSLKMAEADAVNNLTRKISTDTDVAVKLTLSSSNTKAIKGYEESAIQKSHNIIKGYEVQNTFVDKKGKTFVLVFLPYNSKVDLLDNDIIEEISQEKINEIRTEFLEEDLDIN